METIYGYDTTTGAAIYESDVKDTVRNTLDEIYPEVTFGSLSYSASRVLELVDPTAFQQEVLDYFDAMLNNDEAVEDFNDLPDYLRSDDADDELIG